MAVKTKESKDAQKLPGSAHSLSAQKRTVFGKKLKSLRKQGVLPANVSGKHIKSFSVQVKMDEFTSVFEAAGETGLVGLEVDGGVHPVLIHEIHWDPVYSKPLHADFLEVNLSEKVEATVPIEIVGESPAVRAEEGVLVQQMHEVQVEALPTDFPEKIEVDISGLEKVDDNITVSQLSVDRSKIEVKEEDPERIVVSIAPPAKEEEPLPAPEGEVSVEGEAVKVEPGEGVPAGGEGAEGEAQAEGEAPAEEKKEE
ncbi:MAG: 50S ribosomal protein L25 [Patescibacteria group bacterium]